MRGRAGFTLVEVIVVLVILAILAAIAIPALTGYIDKAKWKKLEFQVRTAQVAFQSMLVDQYARDGGFTTHTAINLSDDFFGRISSYADGEGYIIYTFTDKGFKEYESLTTDKDSIRIDGSWDFNNQKKEFDAYTDRSGAIKAFRYDDYTYFNEPTVSYLFCMYVQDVNASDPVTKAIVKQFPLVKSGFNAFRHYLGSESKPPAERLN
ncbi:MAG: prepilin-type N-terminal cleavage/methylation domain-containing protein, partial [Clostridiales Family XIII bacterium]|jgi:prepilin-type N-terminal cleavage/methylation domain-containing protein|nr:prepilin-type N-terminal cleavage/methylation domain-containing protein [Clostridiales Family XIII bacterium]